MMPHAIADPEFGKRRIIELVRRNRAFDCLLDDIRAKPLLRQPPTDLSNASRPVSQQQH
jgi:hypothetical protein